MATKKGPNKGTGGHNRRRLEGKGPTPKAEDRPGHPAHRRAKAAAKRAASRPAADAGRGGPRGPAASPEEIVAGRTAVVEALRAGVPALHVMLAAGLDRDARV